MAEGMPYPTRIRRIQRPISASPQKTKALQLAERLILIGMMLYLTVSANLLVTLGIPYNIPGGLLLLKFHPGSYLIGIAFLLLLRDETERRRWFSAVRAMPILTGFPAVLILVMTYTAARFGLSGIGFYIDTFLMPGLLAIMLITRSGEFKRRTFSWIVILTVLSALLAITESATQWRLFPYLIEGVPANEDFFRSAGLTAHPLEGAQRTIMVLLSAWVLPPAYRARVMPILFLSLLAYGSRSSLAVAAIFLLLGGAKLALSAFNSRQINATWLLLGSMLSIVLVVAGIYLALRFDIGTRIFETLYVDESALSRLYSIQLLGELDTEQFWLGAGPDGVTRLLNLRRGWFNIENFWIVLLIQLGFFLFFFLALALLMFFYRLAWLGPAAIRMTLLAFIIAASSNDALSHKTPNLAILVAILIGASAFTREKSPGPVRYFDECARVLRKMRQEPAAGNPEP